MRSKATTVGDYLESLPENRRKALRQVRQVILDHLPDGLEEAMNWGMIAYQVPLEICPDTYNKQPLLYAALASQKNYMAVYLTPIYLDPDLGRRFEEAYRATGKRYDVGKSCVRFRKLDDLPLDLIGETIASMTTREFVDRVQQAGSARKGRKQGIR
ncbi:MAG: DUF1801 domain-containing protein [Candidatus Neomarinimicrobiota bacterium]|nr:MAG: DUF1801 domain-containing protein [Candidatus Neomarinimicrobiota bacterium]